MIRVVTMPAEQLSHRTAIPGSEQRRLGNLVVASSEERADGDFLTAAAPAVACREQARVLDCSHRSISFNNPALLILLLERLSRELLADSAGRARFGHAPRQQAGDWRLLTPDNRASPAIATHPAASPSFPRLNGVRLGVPQNVSTANGVGGPNVAEARTSPCLGEAMTAPLPPVPADLAPYLVGRQAQGGFRLSTSRWRAALGHLPGVTEALDALPDVVGRQAVTDAFAEAWPENVVGAFVVTMLWGYGDAGYGPSRVARILTQSSVRSRDASQLDSEVVSKLRQSIAIADDQGAVDAYRYLNNDGHIGGLGPAFFTKWLHFGTRRRVLDANTAPILDRLVVAYLNLHDVTIRPGHTDDYAQYIALLARWGRPTRNQPAGFTASEVEERIFLLIRDQQKNRP